MLVNSTLASQVVFGIVPNQREFSRNTSNFYWLLPLWSCRTHILRFLIAYQIYLLNLLRPRLSRQTKFEHVAHCFLSTVGFSDGLGSLSCRFFLSFYYSVGPSSAVEINIVMSTSEHFQTWWIDKVRVCIAQNFATKVYLVYLHFQLVYTLKKIWIP